MVRAGSGAITCCGGVIPSGGCGLGGLEITLGLVFPHLGASNKFAPFTVHHCPLCSGSVGLSSMGPVGQGRVM